MIAFCWGGKGSTLALLIKVKMAALVALRPSNFMVSAARPREKTCCQETAIPCVIQDTSNVFVQLWKLLLRHLQRAVGRLTVFRFLTRHEIPGTIGEALDA